MSCPITLSAHSIPCPSIGGVQAIYLIDKQEVEALETPNTYAIAAGVLTITSGGGAVKVNAYKVEAVDNTFNFTQPVTANQDANTAYVVQTIEGRLDGYTAGNVALAGEIRKGKFECIIETRDGKLIYAGYDPSAPFVRGLRTAGGDAGMTGASSDDPTGLSINLTMQSIQTAPIIESIPTDVFEIITA